MNPIITPPPADQIFVRLMAVEAPAAATADTAAERRIACVVSTETPVIRPTYTEILLHRSPANIDLSRAPLPLLEGHDPMTPAIGIVENLRLENRTLRGELLLGSTARADELWRDILAGVVRTVSIGYRVQQWRQSGRPDAVLMQAERWTPLEVSLVGLPADPAAQIEPPLPGHAPSTPMIPAPVTEEATPTTPTAVEVRAIQRERIRVQQIESDAARHANALPHIRAMVATAIADGSEPATFRHRIVESLAAQDMQRGGHFNHAPLSHLDNAYMHPTRNPHITITHTRSHADAEFEQAATDGILLRAGVARAAALHPGAVDFRGQSLVDLAGVCLSRAGVRVDGSSPMRLVRAAMSNSDFPQLLSSALNKALRVGIDAASEGHRSWVKVTEASNLKAQTRVLLGSAPDLLPVAELAEYQNGELSEDRSTLIPSKFGRIIALSWEAMVNDDLSAFVGIAPAMGRSAGRAEADAIYDLLLAGSGAGVVMQDGDTLFHANHNNIATVATGTSKLLTATALSAVRAKLRRQIGIGGALLNLSPRTLIVPPERETEAEILLAAGTVHVGGGDVQAATPGWLGLMQVVSDPRLEDPDVVYVVASPEEIDCAELAVLEGHPMLEEEDGFSVDARRWKMRHAFGAGFLDHRGIVRLTITA